MGKSPGKWIKTLFGKKSSKSNSTKSKNATKTASDKDPGVGKESALGGSSPVISHPIPVDAMGNADAESGKVTSSTLPTCGSVSLAGHDTLDKQENAESIQSEGTDKEKEEKAAIKAQAAFRGYLARRAFHALRGIIRLQALARGHLVRRQAIATLHCVQAIVKLQAVVRGKKARSSDIGIEVCGKLSISTNKDAKQLGSVGGNMSAQKQKVSANKFVDKLLSSLPMAMPLRMQYAEDDPNAVWIWLERWTYSSFWKPIPLPKKAVEMKSKVRHGYAMETESGKTKRVVRRNSAGTDTVSTVVNTESEKNRRNPRKVTSNSPAEPLEEHPQSELEKVKRNLRKISNSTLQGSDLPDNETETPKRSVRRSSHSQKEESVNGSGKAEEKIRDVAGPTPESKALVQTATLSASQTKSKLETACSPASATKSFAEATYDSVLGILPDIEVLKSASMAKPEFESNSTPEAEDTIAISTDDNVRTLLNSSKGHDVDENHPPSNGQLSSKEEQLGPENQRVNKRRSSFPAKQEYPENGLHSSPMLPSYMAATESAKAKLRGLSSPRFSSDGIDKNGFTRRHSLPSSTNGKISQRLIQASGKGGVKNDRSFSASRDGNDKPIQVEWRR